MTKKQFALSILCLAIATLTHSCCADDSESNENDCGSETGSIISITIDGCDKDIRCQLVKGTNATLRATFKSKVESKTLKAVVYGELPFGKPEFHLPNSNACQSGVVCPLSAGQVNTYIVSIFIDENYPRITVDIELNLMDDNNKKVLCATIPAKIVKKRS